MIRLSSWIAAITAMGFLWHECGEDLGIFCYRIGCNVFTFTRKETLALVPVRHTIPGNLARANAACSNRSFTFSNPSMIRRDFNN
jgi:hypothetical protein